jgi:hypothetical protein
LGTPIKYAAARAVPEIRYLLNKAFLDRSKFGPTAPDKEKLGTKPSNRFYSKQSPPMENPGIVKRIDINIIIVMVITIGLLTPMMLLGRQASLRVKRYTSE